MFQGCLRTGYPNLSSNRFWEPGRYPQRTFLCLAVTSLCHVIQAKGMLEVKRLAVELRVWFASTRSTFYLLQCCYPEPVTIWELLSLNSDSLTSFRFQDLMDRKLQSESRGLTTLNSCIIRKWPPRAACTFKSKEDNGKAGRKYITKKNSNEPARSYQRLQTISSSIFFCHSLSFFLRGNSITVTQKPIDFRESLSYHLVSFGCFQRVIHRRRFHVTESSPKEAIRELG